MTKLASGMVRVTLRVPAEKVAEIKSMVKQWRKERLDKAMQDWIDKNLKEFPMGRSPVDNDGD